MEGSSTQPENELPRKSNLGIWGTCDSNAAEGGIEAMEQKRREASWVLGSKFTKEPETHPHVSLSPSSIDRFVLWDLSQYLSRGPYAPHHSPLIMWVIVLGLFMGISRGLPFFFFCSRVLFSLKNKLIMFRHQRAVLLVINWSS